jgi:cobalamin biosynthesis protein CobT
VSSQLFPFFLFFVAEMEKLSTNIAASRKTNKKKKKQAKAKEESSSSSSEGSSHSDDSSSEEEAAAAAVSSRVEPPPRVVARADSSSEEEEDTGEQSTQCCQLLSYPKKVDPDLYFFLRAESVSRNFDRARIRLYVLKMLYNLPKKPCRKVGYFF